MMHGHEKSDSAIVAVKPANKVERSAAEPVEPRAETKGNVGQQSTRRTQSRIIVSNALARIMQIVAVDTQGGSRMRESRTYGSERGARVNSRPYRDIQFAAVHESACGTKRRTAASHQWTSDYQNWVEAFARNHKVPIEWAEKGVRTAEKFQTITSHFASF